MTGPLPDEELDSGVLQIEFAVCYCNGTTHEGIDFPFGKCCLQIELDCTHMAQRPIAADPKVMLGKPTVAGTRITVELILEKLAAGETVEQILAAHPRLTEAGVRAAIAFAAEVLGAEVVYPMDYVRT